jgi:pyrophosphatase PpaX
MKLYDTYLFDADGTLFDTMDLICQCFDYVLEKYGGQSLPRERIMAGIGSPLVTQIVNHLGPGLDYDMILNDYLQYQLQVMEGNVKLFPEVATVLATLQENGRRLAVVTSRKRLSLEVLLQTTDTSKYFDVLVTPEDTGRHKPDPEPALKAMALLKADKDKTVFVGDAHFDICSGAGAGIDTVFVKWSHFDPSALPVSPTWTIRSMQELCEALPGHFAG